MKRYGTVIGLLDIFWVATYASARWPESIVEEKTRTQTEPPKTEFIYLRQHLNLILQSGY